MSKTSLFLKVLHQVSHSPLRCLSETRVRELLDHPPRSTWHRLISELTNGDGDVPPLLMETFKEETGERFFCLNQRGWQAFMDAQEEGKFLLECYRQIGHLLNSEFTKMVFELPDLDRRQMNDLSRKFLHLVKVKAQESPTSRKILDSVIEALIRNKQLEVIYDGGLRIVRPLTLCQHRDELYLMCYRLKEQGEWEKRTYKLTRINHIKLLDRKFPYPAKGEWDPLKEYQSSSGLILGQVKKVEIRVYGDSRRIFSEKDFFNGEFLNRSPYFDTYLCTYTHPNEFLGQLFVYAQDVEIVGDKDLRLQFEMKARGALSRNVA